MVRSRGKVKNNYFSQVYVYNIYLKAKWDEFNLKITQVNDFMVQYGKYASRLKCLNLSPSRLFTVANHNL
mgnify:CR=1 FL=1